MTIACIDFSNHGHRFYLMQSLLKTLVKNGHTVICITEDAEKVKNSLSTETFQDNKSAFFYSYQHTLPKKISWSIFLNDINVVLNYWRHYNSLLKQLEKSHQLKIDIVIFNYIDVMLSCKLPIFIQKLCFRYKWAGLYVHTRYMRMFKHLGVQTKKTKITDIDYLFKSNKCVGVGIFDNGIVNALEYRLEKKVTLLPDISDVSTDNKIYTLAEEIKKAANGRTIIGNIGISYYAGSLDMAKLALTCNISDFYFVFCGVFDEQSYQHMPNDEDILFFKEFRTQAPENCFWKEGYLADELEYNAILNSFDIIYMMYPEHFTSSNRLTKAAYFNKLVLAANKHCVGENVVKYELGEVASPTNINEQLEKIEVLNSRIKNENTDFKKQEAYYLLNNDEELQKQLTLLLNC